MSDQRLGVYTGSFDPITLGHLNVIQRASRLVDRLIVGVGINIEKKPMFTPVERQHLVQEVTSELPNIDVRIFTGLAVKFVRDCDAHVMVRGIRPLTDIAGEFTMLLANRELDPGIETVFLMADQRYVHISSSLIKQVGPLANDEMLSRFVPRIVVQELRHKIQAQRECE